MCTWGIWRKLFSFMSPIIRLVALPLQHGRKGTGIVRIHQFVYSNHLNTGLGSLVFKWSKVVRFANGPVVKLPFLCCVIAILMLRNGHSYVAQLPFLCTTIWNHSNGSTIWILDTKKSGIQVFGIQMVTVLDKLNSGVDFINWFAPYADHLRPMPNICASKKLLKMLGAGHERSGQGAKQYDKANF